MTHRPDDPSDPDDASSDRWSNPVALPPGTRFGAIELVRVLAIGGFGIVYQGRDHALDRDVAVKEFMPAQLACRGRGARVTVRSNADARTYAVGLQSFVDEAKMLARFSHPAVIKVYSFWKANGTGYMVMPYLRGPTLSDVRKSMSEPPAERWLRSVLDPLLDALGMLHAQGYFHRDISPDNVLVTENGTPVLLDFGAARRLIGDRTESPTTILKPHYSPIEQYAEARQLRQGPWTDLYALAAMVSCLIDGVPPPPATARSIHDERVPLTQRAFPGVSPEFLAAVDWALAVRPQDRPQSVAEFRGAMNGWRSHARPRMPADAAAALAPMRPPSPPVASAPLAFEPTVRMDWPMTAPVRAAIAPMRRVLPPRTLAWIGAALVALAVGVVADRGPQADDAPVGGLATPQAIVAERAADTGRSGMAEPAAARDDTSAALDRGSVPPAAIGTVAPAAPLAAAPSPLPAPVEPDVATKVAEANAAETRTSEAKASDMRTRVATAKPRDSRAALAAKARLAPVREARRHVIDPRAAARSPDRATPASRLAQAKAAAALSGPIQACSSRGLFARPGCIQNLCTLRRYAQHPQCVPTRQIARYRD